MKINLRYTKQFIALTLFLILLIISLQYLLPLEYKTNFLNYYVWHILIYVVALMYISHIITTLGIGKSPYDVQNFFMLSTSFKLLLSCIMLFLYFYFIKIDMKSFVANFFIFYFTYTIFEIKTLLLSLHHDSKAEEKI